MGATRITGTQTRTIFKLNAIADPWGTAQAAGAGDRIRGSITPSFDVQELVPNPIGSGLLMNDDTTAGRITPTISYTMDAGFQNGADKIAAQFFSASSAPAEQTTSQNDYLHRLTLADTPNNAYATFAYETTSADTIEIPTLSVTSFETSFSETDQFFQVSTEFLGNDVELNSSVNTNAVIGAATTADSELVIVKAVQEFYINLQGDGDFGSGDLLTLPSYSRSLLRPQEFAGGVKGSPGNPEPIVTDLIAGTCQLTLQSLDTMDWYDAWENGTAFKFKLVLEGTQIGTGENKSWIEYTPRAKLVQAPSYNITDAGFNTVTLNFTLFEAATAPTAMDSTRPYIELINTRSSAYIA